MVERMLAMVPGLTRSPAAEYAEHRRALVAAHRRRDRRQARRSEGARSGGGAARTTRQPDAARRSPTLRRAAETYGLWRELAEVLTDERKRLVAAAAPRASRRSRSASWRCRASSPRGCRSGGWAIGRARWRSIAEALAVTPRDRACSPSWIGSPASRSAAGVARAARRYEVALAAGPPRGRVELHLRRAARPCRRVAWRDPRARR